MSQTILVELIKVYVRDSALSDALNVLSKPPGLSPRKDIAEMSRWFHSLQENDREMISNIMKLSLDLERCAFFQKRLFHKQIDKRLKKEFASLHYVTDLDFPT